MTQKQKTHRIAVAALLAAVAAVLQFVEFSIPVMPAFVKLDVSDLPALLGDVLPRPRLRRRHPAGEEPAAPALRLQRRRGRAVQLSCWARCSPSLRVSSTRSTRTGAGALWGSVAGAAAMAVISIPINYFIVYPAYVVLYGLPLEAIVGMYQEILGTVAQVPTSNALLNCLMVFNVPFTLCKGLLDVALCFLIYKPLSPLLHK